MILVTGATGTVGREVVQQLAAEGLPVRALVRDAHKAEVIRASQVELVEGDLALPATLDAALAGVEKVFLLSPLDTRQVELQGNLIQAAQRANVRHIVKLSVLGAGPDSPLAMGRWHWQTEQQLERSGIPFTHLQPNSYMQNMVTTYAPTIAAQGFFASAAASDAKISHVDVRDIATVAVKALSEPGHTGKTYAITGPEALSYGEIAAILSDVTGKPIQYIAMAPADYKATLLGFGLPEWLVDDLNTLLAFYNTGGAAGITDTISAIGKKSPTSFNQFARDYAPAFIGG